MWTSKCVLDKMFKSVWGLTLLRWKILKILCPSKFEEYRYCFVCVVSYFSEKEFLYYLNLNSCKSFSQNSEVQEVFKDVFS